MDPLAVSLSPRASPTHFLSVCLWMSRSRSDLLTQPYPTFKPCSTVQSKMRRNCVAEPKGSDVPEHLCRTFISQAHLSPLPMHVRPTVPAHDSALRLYPLPHLVVCADRYDQVSLTEEAAAPMRWRTWRIGVFTRERCAPVLHQCRRVQSREDERVKIGACAFLH